jgi:hypothetical protein
MAKTVIFQCKSCGQQLRAPRARLGEQGKCPRCGHALAVPGPEGWRLWTDQIHATGSALRARLAPLTRSRTGRTLIAAIVVLGAAGLVSLQFRGKPVPAIDPDRGLPSQARLAIEAGTRFRTAPSIPNLSPALKAIAVPGSDGARAVRGSTGVDRAGHIWFGVSAVDSRAGLNRAARLFEFRPESRVILDHGDPISHLERAGLLRRGERQPLIASRIVPGPGGYLYFASGDDTGIGSWGFLKRPEWGSHLWRLKPGSARWEHLMTVPEYLLAVAGGGERVFALGWHGHVLFAYDTTSGAVESVRVGSIEAHMSRNLLADHRGHAYVPRLRFTVETPSRLEITLVEFTPDLREVGQTRLDHYLAGDPSLENGITGVQTLADGSIAFVTAEGYLYRVTPGESGPSMVAALGWFDPQGPTYVATLFTYDGERYLVGTSERDGLKQWLVYDLVRGTSTAVPLPRWAEVIDLAGAEGPLALPIEIGAATVLSGCATRDNQGNFYMAGDRRGAGPLVVQARPHDEADVPR